MKKHIPSVMALLISIAGGIIAAPAGEYYLGKLEAKIDILRGVQQDRRCSVGHIDADGTHEYERLLLVELNFRMEVVESCGNRMAGYNDEQFRRVERIHGAGTFSQIYADVSRHQQHKFEAGGR